MTTLPTEAALEVSDERQMLPSFKELAAKLRPLVNASCNLRDGESGTSCLDGTPIIPLHRATVTSIMLQLENAARLASPINSALVGAERERCAKIARDYASKARARGWITNPESAAKAADHIATAIRATPPEQDRSTNQGEGEMSREAQIKKAIDAFNADPNRPFDAMGREKVFHRARWPILATDCDYEIVSVSGVQGRRLPNVR